MSVAGIDFGNLSVVIGQTSKGGVDVILNESSNRQTATAVSIQGKQRFLGDSGAAMARSNVKNTFTLMKLLVGRKFDSPDVQREIAKLPFKTVKSPSGGVSVVITYNDEPITVPVEHVMAMMLVKAKDVSCKANDGVNIGDAVLAVPSWYTESQRRGVLQACEIAELNCLKVTNENNAIALSYGIFKSAKKLFSETEPIFVMFVDLGYTCYSVSIVSFIQENMKIVASVCDRELGGRDFDAVIVEYLAEWFQTKTGIDVRDNKKAMLKLQAAAEKAKKTLSPNGVNEANISVECLADDRDLAAVLTKEEFEKRAASLIERLPKVINRALEEAGLTREQVSEVEVVGGSTRIGIVKRILGETMGLDANAINNGLKTTMNADEAVARGGALQCAMLSSRMKVKPFNIVDRLSYGIVANFEAVASGDDGNTETAVQLYSRGDEIPHKSRRLTFRNKTSDFDITLSYDDASTALLPPNENKHLGTYTIKVPSALVAGNTPTDVRVTWNLDKNGLVYLQSAQLLEELSMESVDETTVANENKDTEGKEGESKDAAATEGKEGEAPVASAPKKRYRKTDLEVSVQRTALTSEEVKAALEQEASMAFEDRLIVETSDRRNELESYIYAMRDKLDGTLKEFAASNERDTFKKKITEAEDWLYGDGFDSTKQEYIRKIDELRQLGDPIERRVTEDHNRAGAIDGLKKQIDMCKTFAAKYTEDVCHITEEERDKLRKAFQDAEDWMYDAISKQGDLPKNVDPSLTVATIAAKRNTLFSVSNPIMTKPKPAPAAPAPTAQPTADGTTPPPAGPNTGAGSKDGDHSNNGTADGKAADNTAESKDDRKNGGEGNGSSEPMEQSKGGPEEK